MQEKRQIEDYIRVTEVLDPYFNKEFIPPDVLKRAQERGTEVHGAIEAHLKGLGTWITKDYRNYLDSFLYWQDNVKMEIVQLEKRGWDDELMLTGQWDLVCNINGELVLVDYKTSHSPSKSWGLQLSAYRYLSEIKVDKTIVLHLDKKGGLPSIYEYDDMWELYKSAYDVYVHFHPKKVKNVA